MRAVSEQPDQGIAVIIGAGPAGLTAAFELLERTGVRPVVLEQSQYMGGIARTVDVRGNRIDLGGHRFFSKSDRVMRWWLDRLPLQALPDGVAEVRYQQRASDVSTGPGPDPDRVDRVMLLRPRRSRIMTGGRFFSYPVRLDLDTLSKLGPRRSVRIGLSYARAHLRPRPERSLEDFLINRFGHELYATFFESYTEKVWGRPCTEISAEWGAQRIKGLSLRTALGHFLQRAVPGGRGGAEGVAQKDVETSLIERFLYPKLGPGQMWETVADQVRARGGEVLTGWRVTGIELDEGRVRAVVARQRDGQPRRFAADHVFSSMPLRDLVAAVDPHDAVPADAADVAAGLVYRDFLTVGLLLDDLAVREADGGRLRDTWIYLQDPGVRAGRLQIFNNWSPYLVADPGKTWVGLEYFCDVGDDLWGRADDALRALAVDELCAMGLARRSAVLDGVVLRMPKAYPAYFGSYDRFAELRRWLDGIGNLWLVGRNGMHRYNNQDHSMLTAMKAVDLIAAGRTDKAPVWAVNTELDYIEGD